jgi:UDP-glucose 4-epimerase
MRRVLITGMGSELGTRVAARLEARPGVEVIGVDSDPPRRRLRRADFHRIDPRDRNRLYRLVREVDPAALVHLGVYEPNARVGATSAAIWTDALAEATFDAVRGLTQLERIVVRSGIEVYGRRRGRAVRPDESVARDATSPFGRTLAELERRAATIGRRAGVPVALLRCAPIVGSHLASPLGRYLRLPVVPLGLFDPAFSLLHVEDAARAVVAVLDTDHDGPLNVVAPGAVTALQASRIGGRIPVPILGPSWRLARFVSEMLGAPLPDHVQELLTRGRSADGSLAAEVLGLIPRLSTEEVVRELYQWGEVSHLAAVDEAA